MTKPLKRTAVQTLCEGMAAFWEIQEYKDILDFVAEDVDLSDDVSAPKDKVDLVHAPHLVEPLKACTIDEGVRKTVVCAWIDQSGKSLLEQLAILYNLCYNSLQSLLVFPSLDLAVESTQTKLIPLLRKVPQFRTDLEKPFAIRSDRIKLSNGLAYVQGAGTKIVSRSCKLVLADETAIWQSPPGCDNVKELMKRTRSYNECLAIYVSTPTFKENSFWQEFLDGSQGYWTLRCRGCGELTMRSCDLHNLQFESQYSEEQKCYVPVYGSCRLICPKCGHEHTEAEDRCWCIEHGEYVHKYPDRIATHPSFQFGALGSELTVHCWDNIAEVILRSGRTAELEDYISLDNSYKGLPYQERDYNAQGETALSKIQYKDIPQDDIEAVYLACDTQDAFSVLGRFALTRNNELYLIDIHRPRYMWLDDEERRIIDQENRRNGNAPEKTVLDYLDEEICGMRPLMCLIDRQGHRQDEVTNFSRMRRNIVMYSGTSLKYDSIKPSDSVHKLFLFNEKTFRSELIYKLYYDSHHLLRLPEDLSKSDMDEITCVQPDKEKRNGSLYENWIPLHDEVHDAFDVLKMGLCAVKLSAMIFRSDKFKYGEAKVLQKGSKDKPKQEHQERKPRPSAPRRSLFG